MREPCAMLSKTSLAAVLLNAFVLGHAPTATADAVPACSSGVRSQIAALCAGNLIGLGSLSSGAETLVCMPPADDWNGDLVLFARGTTRFSEDDCKLASMTDQLDAGGTSLPRLANRLGFGFATSSCSEDVLAIRECKTDMVELAARFQNQLDALEEQNGGTVDYGGFTGRVFLTGASMGGLVATQLIEQDGGLTLVSTAASAARFAGALAACGPVGSFKKMVRYQGDLLVLVDALYRDELAQAFSRRGLVYPNQARKPIVPVAVRDALDGNLCPALARMIDADSARAGKVLRIMAAAGQPVATDPSGAHTVGETIADVVCSDTLPAISVFEERFGGNPYGNARRVYADPQATQAENAALNRRVDRFAADTNVRRLETEGRPGEPLVTLHTDLDPRVPFIQSELYTLKVLRNGALDNYTPIPSANFGHCEFDREELLAAFAILYFEATGFSLQGIAALLDEPAAFERFLDLVEEFDPAGRLDDLIDEGEDFFDDVLPSFPWP